MSEINNLYSDLPPSTNDFTIDVIGSISKKRYIGEFTCKIPNTKDKCLIAKHQAFLNGPNAEYLDPGTLKIHQKLAYLRYTLMECPKKWWKNTDYGYALMDHNVIENVYDKVLDFETKWLKEVWGDEYGEKFGEYEEEPEDKADEEKDDSKKE